MDRVFGYLLTLLVLALFLGLVLVRPFFYDLVQVPSDAMAPTSVADSYVLVEKSGFGVASLANAVWRFGAPTRVVRRGDVIVFRAGGEALSGRVVALGGDELRYRDDGTWKLNGTPVPQAAIADAAQDAAGFEVREETLEGRRWQVRLRKGGQALRTSGVRPVPAGTYFVLADSRDQGTDSRDMGAIAANDVLGLVVRTSHRAGAHWPEALPALAASD